MYANSNSSGSKACNDNSNNIPEWKKKLIMKKRVGSLINIDEHCRRNPDMLSQSNCDNNDIFSSRVKICHSEFDLKDISPLKTVTIGDFNVELRSVRSAIERQNCYTDSAKFDHLNGFESENEDCHDLQYGPGIVDRLRERFLKMGAKKQRKPVRRFSSLENLPCSFVKSLKINTRNISQNSFKVRSENYYSSGNVKKAQSMETLIYSTQEQPIFSGSRRPNVCTVKARILAKNPNPMMHTDETEELSEMLPSSQSVHRLDSNHSTSASSIINEDELPKPDTVKQVKKIFETSLGRQTIFVNNIKLKGNEDVSYEQSCVKEFSLPKKESLSPETDKLIDKTVPSLRHSKLSLDGTICQEKVDDVIPVAVQESDGKGHLEIYQHSASSSRSSGAELLRAELESSPGMLVVPKSTVLKETTSIVFDFRGKDVKPNISLSPTPFGCRPARILPKNRSVSPPHKELNGVANDANEEDWDEMDIGADLPAFSGIVFSGENVKVGRGAILKTRNKKLTIQFDDEATSTFDYPSENTSPSPVDENTNLTYSSFNPLLALGSLANSRLSHYTPQAVTSNIDLEFGISQQNNRLPLKTKIDKNEKLDEDPTLPAIVPTKPEDASGWSSTSSTDILF